MPGRERGGGSTTIIVDPFIIVPLPGINFPALCASCGKDTFTSEGFLTLDFSELFKPFANTIDLAIKAVTGDLIDPHVKIKEPG
ncbi:MAG: hypothetical protein EXS36_20145 [Pedosphaera sp.]|nr:hypothetical protein [Pedosphaera sp.]